MGKPVRVQISPRAPDLTRVRKQLRARVSHLFMARRNDSATDSAAHAARARARRGRPRNTDTHFDGPARPAWLASLPGEESDHSGCRENGVLANRWIPAHAAGDRSRSYSWTVAEAEPTGHSGWATKKDFATSAIRRAQHDPRVEGAEPPPLGRMLGTRLLRYRISSSFLAE